MSATKRAAKAAADEIGELDLEREASSPISHRLLAELFGEDILSSGPLRWYLSIPVERRQLWLVIAGAALMFLPMLGAVGLWDPWETHFAEVGREMMARHDWVVPWWERVYFFSKPPLTMWLTNIGLWLSGAQATVPNQEMGIWADWGVRLPIALLAIAAIGMLYLAASRLFDRRIGLLAAFACMTMPLYAILARQAITDTPFVALLTIGLCCFCIAEFDPNVKHRDPWLFAFYAAIGFSTLAKEIPFGFGIPGAVILLYLILTGDWGMLRRVRLFWGGLLAILIAAPWVVVMCFTKDVEEEGENFVHRYWLHDNFSRLLSGVHTTSPNANFTYYIEQLGYGMFPWSALLPGALITTAVDPRVRADRAKLFVGLWAFVPFLVISLSATKFEHYAFPCFPPIAILTAFYLDKLWREGLRRHTFSLLLSGAFFAMIGQGLFQRPKIITEMFTYNPDRPYPTNLIADPMPVVGAILALGGVVLLLGFLRGAKGKAVAWGAATVGFGFLVYLSTHLASTGWVSGPQGQWAPKDVMGGTFVLFGVLAALTAATSNRAWFLASIAGCALGFSGYLSWVHWEQLSPHWTQREILHTYYTQRQPGEPLAAFEMNWKGETFYSKNAVRQIQDPRKLSEFFREPAGPGGRHWVIIDSRQPYVKMFQQQLAAEGKHMDIKDDSSVKFFLVTVE
jgi:4-amino-4-deoxy-L-arabinose transferase-like glycosyltransferase